MDAEVARASEYLNRGKTSEALPILDAVLKRQPNDAHVWFLKSMAVARIQGPEASLTALLKAASLDPNHLDAQFFAAKTLRELGRASEALPYAEALSRSPARRPEMMMEPGMVFFANGNQRKAHLCFEEAIACAEATPIAAFWSGVTLLVSGRTIKAKHVFEKCAWRFAVPQLIEKLAESYLLMGDWQEASRVAKEGLFRFPENPNLSTLYAKSLANGRQPLVAAAWDEALRVSPNPVETLVLKADIEQVSGDFETATSTLIEAMTKDPGCGMAYANYFRSKKAAPTDAPIAEKAIAQLKSGRVSNLDKRRLHFALGKYYDDLGDLKSAFDHYDAAHSIAPAGSTGTPTISVKRVAQICDSYRELFDATFLEKYKKVGKGSSKPIFVLGRPRSGTTLVESILSRHPSVAGAGELVFWSYAAGSCLNLTKGELVPRETDSAAEEYLELVEHLSQGKERVVDKFTGNLLIAGLIHLALPPAKIVCLHRNPADVALSLWTTPMETDSDALDDRQSVVESVRLHNEMLKHWLKVIPPESLHLVSYEGLISDPEPEIRGLLQFLELPWSQDCLHPEASTRDIVTPSVWQARQPINPKNSAKWKKYEDYLGEFLPLVHEEDDLLDQAKSHRRVSSDTSS